ncbi:hypothetical protein J5N97_009720 [Dioscorea zingiberensis]|uniref:BHLH domain-containing protein n=1 Tax=Dioscorea zingiberensis TaxID=325984 RepID=A0A9D5HLR8_9LILI|nr:hypothetical protein J5N97_009720 [Dioscorea zingiberensis]
METEISNRGSPLLSMKPASEIRACKSHSEAERRRRQRINGHLATLRTLLPSAARGLGLLRGSAWSDGLSWSWAIGSVRARVVRAEIATIGGRTRSMVELEMVGSDAVGSVRTHLQDALRSVLWGVNPVLETWLREV